jgi:hypothetical protein
MRGGALQTREAGGGEAYAEEMNDKWDARYVGIQIVTRAGLTHSVGSHEVIRTQPTGSQTHSWLKSDIPSGD